MLDVTLQFHIVKIQTGSEYLILAFDVTLPVYTFAHSRLSVEESIP